MESASNFLDQITDKTQLQRFLGCLNYVSDFLQNIRPICKPLYERLKKNPKPWTEEHIKTVQKIKSLVKSIPCLSLINPRASLIVETDASDIGYGGILKQSLDKKESIVRFHSGIWNSTKKNYSTVKKEILSIVLCVQKFQSDLINKSFVIKTDSRASKFVLEKDGKNLVSKQIFARWQAISSCFDFQILPIKRVEIPL